MPVMLLLQKRKSFIVQGMEIKTGWLQNPLCESDVESHEGGVLICPSSDYDVIV